MTSALLGLPSQSSRCLWRHRSRPDGTTRQSSRVIAFPKSDRPACSPGVIGFDGTQSRGPGRARDRFAREGITGRRSHALAHRPRTVRDRRGQSSGAGARSGKPSGCVPSSVAELPDERRIPLGHGADHTARRGSERPGWPRSPARSEQGCEPRQHKTAAGRGRPGVRCRGGAGGGRRVARRRMGAGHVSWPGRIM